jgi:hypothetical protein
VVGGHADAADDSGDQGERIAGRQSHRTDARTGQDQPGGQQPARLAAVAVGADERLHHSGGETRREGVQADRPVAVVTFHDQKRQQRPKGA